MGHFCRSRASREGAAEIKVLKDLGLLFLLGIYRHSGPNGPVAIGIRMARGYYPGHPVHPGHPASDAIDIQGLSDLVQRFGGDRQVRGERRSSCPSCLSWPSCFRHGDAAGSMA